MSALLGLMSGRQLDTYKSENYRRRIFYEFPQGGAPIMGILSLSDTQFTDKPEFGWWEKRMTDQKTQTASISSGNGCFAVTGSDTPKTNTGWYEVADTVVRVWCDSTEKFSVNHVVIIPKVPRATGTQDLVGVITSIVSSTKFEMRLLEAAGSSGNALKNADGTTATTTTVDLSVIVIGSANYEGASDTSRGMWTPPVGVTNNTQIFRRPFSFTRTALKMGTRFDKTGIYRDKMKENSINHMIEIEKALIFGVKSTYNATVDSEDVIMRTMGGILYYLRLWEAGSTYGNTAATADTDDNKRIIENTTGVITRRTYNKWLERAFRRTDNANNEKLCLCGSGFLECINELYGTNTSFISEVPMEDAWGMSVVKHVTPFGTLYYKTHPLFTQLSDYRYSALILDVNNIKWRPLNDSDTTLLKNRQLPDADRRKDEWMTEGGLEVNSPESHMFIKSVTSVQAG